MEETQELTFDDVEEARTDLEIKVEIPFKVKNGDGQYHEKPLPFYYRPITNEMLQLTNSAEALSQALVRWPFKPEPTFEHLSQRPQPFLNKIRDAIMGDYFPK